jgi:hypothetical protein
MIRACGMSRYACCMQAAVLFKVAGYTCILYSNTGVASENSCFYAARHPIRLVLALHCTFACFCHITPTVTIATYNTGDVLHGHGHLQPHLGKSAGVCM